MMLKNKEKIKSVLTRFYVPWIALYIFLISGTLVFGATVYSKNDENQLPSGYIELKVDKTRYQLGEVVSFTVINHFPTAVYVTNQCPKEPLNVYRWKNEQWIELHDVAKDDSECHKEPRNVPIPSEGSRSYDFLDWPNLFKEPGVYRIATAIDHYSDVPFQDFVVLEPAKVIEIEEKKTLIVPLPVPVPVPVVEVPVPLPPPVIYEEVEDTYYEEQEDDEDESRYEDGDEDEYEEDDD